MSWLDRPSRTTGVVALTTLLFQLMVLPIWRPLILPDESGFLLNAKRLGTGTGPSGLAYFPGYSVILSPLTAVTTDIETLMRLAQSVNGILGALSAVLAVGLARRLRIGLSESALTAIGLAIGAYPAYRLFGAFALSENLLVPWTTALCLAFERAERRASRVDAVIFGLIAGLSLSIHTRALALTVASVGAAVLLLRGQSLVSAISGAAIGVALSVSLVSFSLDASVVTGAPRDSPSALILDAMSVRGVVEVITSAGGQVFYLLTATAGIAGLGLWALVDSARPTGSDSGIGPRSVGVLAIGIFVASIGISSLFLAGREGDFAIYGRYGEGVLVPLLVAGLVTLASDPATARHRAMRLAFALPALAAVLVLVRGPEAFEGRMLLLNIAGVFPVVEFVGTIRLSALTAVGVTGIVIVVGLLTWRFVLGTLALSVVFLATAAFSINRSAAAIDALDQQDDLIVALERTIDVLTTTTNDTPCVALDIWQLPDRWHQENYRLRLDDTAFEYWSSATPKAPCSDLVVSQRPDLDDVFPGAAVVAVEPFGRQALWILPGELQEAVNTSDGTIPDPLATFTADQGATVDLVVASTTVALGSNLEMTTSVANNGPLGFFPQDSFSTSAGSINVGLELRSVTEPDVRLHEPFRVRLPRALASGETESLDITVRPEDIDGSVQPGTYLLVASLVQEGVAWTDFSASVEIEVTAP